MTNYMYNNHYTSAVYTAQLTIGLTVKLEGIGTIDDTNAHKDDIPSGISRRFQDVITKYDAFNDDMVLKQHISSGISRHDTDKITIKSFKKSSKGNNNIFTFVYQYDTYNIKKSDHMQ
ncbi:MAG: hypothetical protein ACOYO1_12015 [Bacteroidales bacterium]